MRERVLLLLFFFADIRAADPNPSVQLLFQADVLASLFHWKGGGGSLPVLIIRALIRALYPELKFIFH